MSKSKDAYITYAGIGDVEVPEEIQDEIESIAETLSNEGIILRTRGEEGTDIAFLNGVADENVELYLPWEDFNDFESPFIKPELGAYEVAWKHHPNWLDCEPDDRRFHAVGAHVILGEDLKSPCNFLLCYSNKGEAKGDTGNVIAIADSNFIPVFDLGLGIDYTLNRLEEWMDQHL